MKSLKDKPYRCRECIHWWPDHEGNGSCDFLQRRYGPDSPGCDWGNKRHLPEDVYGKDENNDQEHR